MDINGLLVKRQAGKRVHEKVVEFLVHILLDILTQHLVFRLLLQLECVLNVPSRRKYPHLYTGIALNRLRNLLMLEVEGLHGTRNEVITANQLLLVLFILLVLLAYLFILQLVGGGRQIEGEDSGGLLQQNVDVLLQVLHGQLACVLLLVVLLLALQVSFRVDLGFAAAHERFLLVHRTAALHFRVVLGRE